MLVGATVGNSSKVLPFPYGARYLCARAVTRSTARAYWNSMEKIRWQKAPSYDIVTRKPDSFLSALGHAEAYLVPKGPVREYDLSDLPDPGADYWPP